MSQPHRTSSTVALRILTEGTWCIRVIGGPDRGMEYQLTGRSLEIGSDDSLPFQLTDPLVSPRHIRFEPEGTWWFVRDLESENGTFINGRVIQRSSVLPGEVIRIGNTSIGLDYIALPPDATAVRRGSEWFMIPRIVAHELRNYLQFLEAGVQMLKKDPVVSGRFDPDIQRMELASGKIEELIQILRAGCVPPVLRRVNLAEQIWEQVAMLESIAAGKGISMISQIPCEPCMVMADSNQMGRAIFNLLKNAFEACSREARVSIRMSRSDQWISLAIEDTGSGMDPETLASMWTPLFTTKPGGNGLGAFIARTIILRHEGRIGAFSTPGKGTRIEIELREARYEK